jgi:hypothetical protein
MTQFQLDKKTAMRWTGALAVSGLFNVTLGHKHRLAVTGTPTKFEYLDRMVCDEDWEAFIVALRDTVAEEKREGIHDDASWFRATLAINVRHERTGRGLPTQALTGIINAMVRKGMIEVSRTAPTAYRVLRRTRMDELDPDIFDMATQ